MPNRTGSARFGSVLLCLHGLPGLMIIWDLDWSVQVMQKDTSNLCCASSHIRSLWSGGECTQTPPQAPLREVSPSNTDTPHSPSSHSRPLHSSDQLPCTHHSVMDQIHHIQCTLRPALLTHTHVQSTTHPMWAGVCVSTCTHPTKCTVSTVYGMSWCGRQ